MDLEWVKGEFSPFFSKVAICNLTLKVRESLFPLHRFGHPLLKWLLMVSSWREQVNLFQIHDHLDSVFFLLPFEKSGPIHPLQGKKMQDYAKDWKCARLPRWEEMQLMPMKYGESTSWILALDDDEGCRR